MTWYVSVEYDPEEFLLTNAGGKARSDITSILESDGCEPMPVSIVSNRQNMRRVDKISAHNLAYKNWTKATSELSNGDVLIIQFPLVAHNIFFFQVMNTLKQRGVQLVLLIHDLDGLRSASREVSLASKLRFALEERAALMRADVVIAHNDRMSDAIVRRYGVDQRRIVSLGIFDYLASGEVPEHTGTAREPVCVAGNLSPEKSSYLGKLPRNVRFALYGGGYANNGMSNVVWHGVVPAEELPSRLEGGFGLVWDGDTSETCSGATGKYLKINNPHKTSLYLAAGLPVIIWDQAALASFVEEHGCGITISSLSELRQRIDEIDYSTYKGMIESATAIGRDLRKGKYTDNAIRAAESLLREC